MKSILSLRPNSVSFRSLVFLSLFVLFLITVGVGEGFADDPVVEGATTEVAPAETGDATTDTTTSGASLPMLFYILPIFGIIGLAFTFWKAKWVNEQDPGNEKMVRIANNISEGAMSFLKAEYSILAIFVICLLYTSPSPRDRTRSRMPSSA